VHLPFIRNKPVKECREGGCGMGQISPVSLKILHLKRELRVSVDVSVDTRKLDSLLEG